MSLRQLQAWIEKVCVTIIKGDFNDSKSFHSSIKNGVLLCGLISKILRKVGNFHEKPVGIMKEIQNLDYFIKECKIFGLEVNWKVRDLHSGKDLKGVEQTLFEIAKKCETLKDFKGPQLKDVKEKELTVTPITKTDSIKIEKDAPKVGDELTELQKLEEVKRKREELMKKMNRRGETSLSKEQIERQQKLEIARKKKEEQEEKEKKARLEYLKGQMEADNITRLKKEKKMRALSIMNTKHVFQETLTKEKNLMINVEEEELSPKSTNQSLSIEVPSTNNNTTTTTSPNKSKPRSPRSFGALSSTDDESNNIENILKVLNEPMNNGSVNLTFLKNLNDLILKKDTDWNVKLVEDKGFLQITKYLLTTDKKTRSLEDDSFQEVCVKCIESMMKKSIANNYLVSEVPDVPKSLFLILSNSNEKMKKKILVLLSMIGSHSELGFWAILDAANNYRVIKKETKRFYDLVGLLKGTKDERLQASIIILVNTIVNSATDKPTKVILKNEFISLGFMEIVDKIKSSSIQSSGLKNQIQDYEKIFTLDEFDQDIEMTISNISNPNEIMNVLRFKLSNTNCFSSFRNTLQQLLILSTNDDENKVTNTWSQLEKMLDKSVGYGQLIIESEKEKKLQDQVLTQQNQISFLETKISNLKVDELKQQITDLNNKVTQMEKMGVPSKDNSPTGGPLMTEPTGGPSMIEPTGGPPMSAPTGGPPMAPTGGPTGGPPGPIPMGGPSGGPPGPPPMGGPSGGPPGPPGMGPSAGPSLPKLPNLVPSVATRNIYIDQLSKIKVGKTLWITKNVTEKTNDVKIDAKNLEKLFAATPKKDVSVGNDKEKKPEVISLIDPKKSNNVNLFLGYLRIPNEIIYKAIVEMDEEALSQQNIAALKEKAPTPEEIDTLSNYDGDVNVLANCDKFYLSIKDIPRFEGRLSCWNFKIKFDQDVASIRPDIEAVVSAANEISESSILREFLSVILAIANFLNGKSPKKNCYGFKLSSLSKLKETKSSNGKTNLLQYIALFVSSKYPNLLKIQEDLPNLEAATRVALPEVMNEYRKIQSGIKELKKEIEFSKESTLKGDKFLKVMTPFCTKAESEVTKIEKASSDLTKSLKEMAILFGEDDKMISKDPSIIFSLINNFI
eukprot:gene8948-897_t